MDFIKQLFKRDEIQEKLKSLNITAPTSVQQNVIPKILEE